MTKLWVFGNDYQAISSFWHGFSSLSNPIFWLFSSFFFSKDLYPSSCVQVLSSWWQALLWAWLLWGEAVVVPGLQWTHQRSEYCHRQQEMAPRTLQMHPLWYGIKKHLSCCFSEHLAKCQLSNLMRFDPHFYFCSFFFSVPRCCTRLTRVPPILKMKPCHIVPCITPRSMPRPAQAVRWRSWISLLRIARQSGTLIATKSTRFVSQAPPPPSLTASTFWNFPPLSLHFLGIWFDFFFSFLFLFLFFFPFSSSTFFCAFFLTDLVPATPSKGEVQRIRRFLARDPWNMKFRLTSIKHKNARSGHLEKTPRWDQTSGDHHLRHFVELGGRDCPRYFWDDLELWHWRVCPVSATVLIPLRYLSLSLKIEQANKS